MKTKLAEVARKAIEVLRARGQIEQTELVALLDVKRRRIYDILSILQGTGLVKRKQKIITWTGENIQTVKETKMQGESFDIIGSNRFYSISSLTGNTARIELDHSGEIIIKKSEAKK